MKIERAFIGAGLIALPFVFSYSGEGMREPKSHALIVLAGIYMSLKLGKIATSLGTGVALCYMSAFFCQIFPSYELLAFSAALGSCFLFRHIKKNDIQQFLKFLKLGAFFCAIYAAIQKIGIDPILVTDKGKHFDNPMAFFGQQTLYGPFCVAGFAAALFGGNWILAVILAVPVYWIDSSFTYLSFGVVIAVFLISRFGRWSVFFMTMISIPASVFLIVHLASEDRIKVDALNDNGRFALWHSVATIANVHPWMGRGFVSFPRQFPVFQDKKLREKLGLKEEGMSPRAISILREAESLFDHNGVFLSAHNEYLQVFYEFGYIGIGIVAWIIASFAWCWVTGPRDYESWAMLAIFSAFLANAIGNFPFHLIPQALIPIWCFVAVTERRKDGTLESWLINLIRINSLDFLNWLKMWVKYLGPRPIKGSQG